MTKHFITVIGTGNYSPVFYYDPDTEGDNPEVGAKTRYVQEAVLRKKIGISDTLRISIFATTQAIAANYNNSDKNEDCGLHEVLVNGCGIREEQISLTTIPSGNNEDELMEIFHKVVEAIKDDECVYFDITHSYRSLPMQIMSAICFCDVIKNIEVGGIFYGAYQINAESAPIINLSPFLDIIQLSHAANSFAKYGNSEELNDLSKSYSARVHKDSDKNNEVKMEAGLMSNLASSLKNLTDCISTSRGAYKEGDVRFKKNEGMSTARAFMKYKEKLDKYRSDKRVVGGPISKLTDLLEDKTKVFDEDFGFDVEDKNGNLKIGIATVKWTIENGLIQQGYTAIDESVKTYLCLKYGLDETEKEYRETVCKKICILLNQEKNDREATKTRFDEQIKELLEVVQREDPDEYQKISALLSAKELDAHGIIDDIPIELVEFSCGIGDLRNTMNHFGYSSMGQFTCDKLIKELNAMYDSLLELITAKGE